MAHESSITHDKNDTSFSRIKNRKLELLLVVFVVLFLLFVFGVLVVATMIQNDRAATLAPVLTPTAKP